MKIEKRNQLIGLDIGSNTIKAVEIDHTGKERILKNFGIIELPPTAIVEGVIKEESVVVTAILNLLSNLKIRNKNIATSVSGYSVIVKRINVLVKQGSPDFNEKVQAAAEQYIPFNINEVDIDYDILPKELEEEDSENKSYSASSVANSNLLLVAAKKDIIEERIALLNAAGLAPMVMDVDLLALQNAFEISTDAEDRKGLNAIVSLGAEKLEINIIQNGISLFSRDSSIGGSQLTEAIMADFGESFEEAEAIKLGEKPVENISKLRELFIKFVLDWVNEIKRVIDFVGNTYSDEPLKKIFLTGGSCRLPGFKDYLKRETKLLVEELDPFKGLQFKQKLFDPAYLSYMRSQAGVAVGLALRSIADK